MFQSIAVRSQSIGTRALGHLAIRVMIFAALPKRIARVPTMPDSTPGGRALPVPALAAPHTRCEASAWRRWHELEAQAPRKAQT